MLVLGTLLPGATPALALPLAQTSSASVTLSPRQAEAGESVRVNVTGLSGLPAAGTSLCIGFLGPGTNLETGASPRFQSRLGTVAISAAGSGSAEVRVPVQAVAGVYRIRVGGCPPQPDLAPLAAIAEAQLTVTRGGPTGLPTTGGGFTGWPAASAAIGALVVLCGAAARRLTRHRHAGSSSP